jgi:hypothetical protein
MTIVTYRHRPKRLAKPAQAATIKVPRIVQHTPKGRAWKLPPDDPEAKARAVAFFAKMGVKRPEEGS